MIPVLDPQIAISTGNGVHVDPPPPDPLVALRVRLRELEADFARDIRLPGWPASDGEADARGWEVGIARRELAAAERQEKKGREG